MPEWSIMQLCHRHVQLYRRMERNALQHEYVKKAHGHSTVMNIYSTFSSDAVLANMYIY